MLVGFFTAIVCNRTPKDGIIVNNYNLDESRLSFCVLRIIIKAKNSIGRSGIRVVKIYRMSVFYYISQG